MVKDNTRVEITSKEKEELIFLYTKKNIRFMVLNADGSVELYDEFSRKKNDGNYELICKAMEHIFTNFLENQEQKKITVYLREILNIYCK